MQYTLQMWNRIETDNKWGSVCVTLVGEDSSKKKD